MAKDLAIDQSALDSCVSIGGIYKSYLAECEDITSYTFDADGQLTGLVMATAGAWNRIVYDDDDDFANFVSEPNRESKKITFTQTSNMSFSGITNDKVKKSNLAKDCCCVVAIHFVNDGATILQGYEYDHRTGTHKLSKTKAKVTPRLDTSTPEGQSVIQWTIESEGRQMATLVDAAILTDTAIEAL